MKQGHRAQIILWFIAIHLCKVTTNRGNLGFAPRADGTAGHEITTNRGDISFALWAKQNEGLEVTTNRGNLSHPELGNLGHASQGSAVQATLWGNASYIRVYMIFQNRALGHVNLNLHNSGYRATADLRIARIDVKCRALAPGNAPKAAILRNNTLFQRAW